MVSAILRKKETNIKKTMTKKINIRIINALMNFKPILCVLGGLETSYTIERSIER
jgi:hypothetical protein